MDEQKRCIKCGEVKPLTGFYHNRGRKDGLTEYCKTCVNTLTIGSQAYFVAKSIEKVNAGLVTEKRCPGCKRVLPLSAYTPNKHKTYGICSRCRECAAVQERERRAKAKAKGKPVHHERDLRLKLAALRHYSGSDVPYCACCKTTYLSHLTIDHANQDGSMHRKVFPRAMQISRWLRDHNYPEGFRVLCFNCNVATFRLGRCGCQDEAT